MYHRYSGLSLRLSIRPLQIKEIIMVKSKESYQFNFAIAPGEYVEEHMEYYGYSYQKFADICNCSVETVRNIVKDKAPLTMRLAKKFERELDIPADLLMRIEKKYRIFQQPAPAVKVKKQKKESLVVQQPLAVAQQFG